MSEKRRFMLTLFAIERYEELKAYLLKFDYKYFVAAQEVCPTTNKDHIHIFVQYKKNVKLSVSKLCTAHFDVCDKNSYKCSKYVKKEGCILDELGIIPAAPKYEQVRQLLQLNAEDVLEMHVSQLKDWKLTKQLDQGITLDLFTKYSYLKVYYIWGVSGCGKTNRAKEIIKENLQKYDEEKFDNVKYIVNFWHGISELQLNSVCLYDEFRDSQIPAAEFINFIDYNIHSLNIKNGSVQNRYKTIIITSIQDPNTIYDKAFSQEEKQQWLRRMEIIHIEEETLW